MNEAEWRAVYDDFRRWLAKDDESGDDAWHRILNRLITGEGAVDLSDPESLDVETRQEIVQLVNDFKPWYRKLNGGAASTAATEKWLFEEIIPWFSSEADINSRGTISPDHVRKPTPGGITAPGFVRPGNTELPPAPGGESFGLRPSRGVDKTQRQSLVERRDNLLRRINEVQNAPDDLRMNPATGMPLPSKKDVGENILPHMQQELLEIDQELFEIDDADAKSTEGGTRDRVQEHGGQRDRPAPPEGGTPHTRQGVNPGEEMIPIKSWDEMSPEEKEMETKTLSNTLGLADMGIETRDELPAGETAAGYWQQQDAFTKWQQWEKAGKIFDIRQKLFDAGYYRGTSKDGPAWTFDFSEGVNDADVQALTNAMTDANLEDPTQGGKTLGLQKFLRGENREIQESVSERAQLRQDIKTRMYQYGLSDSQTSVDSYVQKLMNGTIAYTDMDQAMLERAKQLYPAWVKQLDSGMTMDAIADPYITRAETILELPNVTWDDPLLAGALNKPGKDGTPSYMSLTEFDDKLRDDPRWEYTSDAHNYYGSLQNQIMETWGM